MIKSKSTIFQLIISLLLVFSALPVVDLCRPTAAQPLEQSSRAAYFSPFIIGSALGSADLTPRTNFNFSDRTFHNALIPGQVSIVSTRVFVFTPSEVFDRLASKFGPKAISIRAPPCFMFWISVLFLPPSQLAVMVNLISIEQWRPCAKRQQSFQRPEPITDSKTGNWLYSKDLHIRWSYSYLTKVLCCCCFVLFNILDLWIHVVHLNSFVLIVCTNLMGELVSHEVCHFNVTQKITTSGRHQKIYLPFLSSKKTRKSQKSPERPPCEEVTLSAVRELQHVNPCWGSFLYREHPANHRRFHEEHRQTNIDVFVVSIFRACGKMNRGLEELLFRIWWSREAFRHGGRFLFFCSVKTRRGLPFLQRQSCIFVPNRTL